MAISRSPWQQRTGFAILDEKEEDQNHEDEKPLVMKKGLVEAKHVQFAYEEGHPVLRDLNFKANPR